MRRLFAGGILGLSLAVAVVSPASSAEPPPLDLKGTRILVCAGYFDLINIPAVKRLEAAGAEVRPGQLGNLTWEAVRPYHLIIVIAHSPPEPGGKAKTAVRALEQFVKAGGGLLFFRHFYAAERADEYLKPFEATMPWELILDPTHTFRTPTGWRISYAYTEDVATDHPVTEGVKGIWYPAADRFQFHTSPLQVSPAWKTLVRGSKQSASHWIGGLHEEHKTGPGAWAASPPIIAAREYGAGAVVLIGISPMEALLGQGLPAYQDIVLERGDGVRPSQFRRLYQNALRWLAGRARGSVEIGQGGLPPLENPWAKANVPRWTEALHAGDLCNQPARGLIGARSNLSDGRASPEAMIARAKAVGLQWIAFSERLEDFSSEKWAQLRKLCREASTGPFAALPGLDYADDTGTRYVVFGDFDWPPDTVFSEDGQRIIVPQWWFNIGVPPNGPYHIGGGGLRPWDFSMYNFWPVRTTIEGRQVEEALEGYRYVHGIHDDPLPMAVEIVRDESQLEAAAGRMANFITQDQPGDLTEFFRRHGYYGSFRGFVSEGPLVTDWRAFNETRVTGGQWWLPGTERYRIKLSVRSDAPIVEVKIWDGPRLFRCVRPAAATDARPAASENDPAGGPGGARRDYDIIVSEADGVHGLTLWLDLPHDQQRQLFAEITDANGKRAITGGLSIRDWLNWRFMCSDRGNTICDAIQVDEHGPYLTGPTAPYQRKMTMFGIFPGYGERHFNILPPDFDGGMRPMGMQVMPRVDAEDFALAPPDATLETRMGIPVASRDGILQEDNIVGYFPCAANAWERKCPPRDIRDVRIRYRYLNLTPRARDPGVILLEGSIRFEKAMRLKALHVFSIFHTSQPGEGDHYALVTPETTVAGLTAPDPFSASGRMAPGSFACLFPSPWGSSGAMALDDGYVASVHARAPANSIQVALDNLPREVKAGEEILYRLVLKQGALRERPNTADWERFARTMGLRGAPGYEITDIRAGQVRGTKFMLELEPSEGGFVGTISHADLPVRLPVFVAGMNPNWTFAWFDLDRNQWFPSAVDPVMNRGFFTLNTRLGAHRIFAGHPVIADQPDVRISVLSDGRSEVHATVNNVSDQPRRVRLRLHPALGAGAPQDMTLAPGQLRDATFLMR